MRFQIPKQSPFRKAAQEQHRTQCEVHRDILGMLREKEEGLPRVEGEWHRLELYDAAALAGTGASLGGDRDGFTKKMMAQLYLQDKEIEKRAKPVAVYQNSLR